MTKRRAAITAVALAAAATGTIAVMTSTPQNRYDLEILFDGGYIYHLNSNDFVEVKTLTNGLHPMRVRVTQGTVSEGGLSEFRLSGARLELLPDGAAPSRSKPGVPTYDGTQTGCDEARDKAKPNNLLFLPNLGEAATGMETKLKRGKNPERPAKAGSIILTGGGVLSIHKDLGGCVQFRKADGSNYGDKRSMANGIAGIRYNWSSAGARYITLRITDVNNKVIDVKIQPSQGVIRLHVGSFDPPQYKTAPYEIMHFRAFDDAFDSLSPAKRITLWWLNAYEVSPGIDCPPGMDPDPWPVP